MAMSFKESQAAFAAESNNQSTNYNSDQYPFWQIEADEIATIRFLPDADESNPKRFLLERKMHKLHINGKRRSVACPRTWDEKAPCPICELSSEYYNADDKVNGKKYWRSVQHVAYGVVVKDPIPVKDGEESAQGKVKTLTLTWQVYDVIKAAMTDGELDEYPCDYDEGLNFNIKKTMTGSGDNAYAQYTHSNFVRKGTKTSDHIDLETVELVDLKTLLPKELTYEELETLLQADITGEEMEDKKPTQNADDQKGMLNKLKDATAEAKKEATVVKIDGKNDTVVAVDTLEVNATMGGDKPAVDDEANAILQQILENR